MTNRVKQESQFSLNATTAFHILTAVPQNTRCFQTHEEGGYDGDFVGTVDEFLAALDVNENTGGDLMWNVDEKTVRLIELTIIRAGEIASVEGNDDHCVLLIFQETGQRLELPRLGTEKIPDSKWLGVIDLSKKCTT